MPTIARVAALLALVAAGCDASNAKGSSVKPQCSPPECPVDALQLAIEVTPPEGRASTLSDVDLPSVQVMAQTGVLGVQLPAPVTFVGKIVVANQTMPPFTNGYVVATRPSRIPGRPERFYRASIDSTGAYRLAVSESLPGETYKLRIVSTDTSVYPPQTFTQDATIARGVSSREIRFDLHLDDPATLTQVTGTITDVVGKPVPGMRVQALEVSTQSSVSSTGVTDGSGAYTIRLAKTLPTPMLTLTATPTAAAPTGTPALEAPFDASAANASPVLRADLATPPLPAPQRFNYRVTGIGSSGAELPVVGATCQFDALVSDASSSSHVSAVFTASAVTDADGNAVVELVPSDSKTPQRAYQVTVSPRAGDQFEATKVMITAGTTQGYGPAIVLKQRPTLSGRVLAPDGRPVQGATVQPSPSTVQAASDAAALAGLVQFGSTTTDADGRFSLAVDSGAYDVGILPLSASGLPRLWLGATQVAAPRDLGDVRLKPGTLVKTIVVDANNQGLPGAGVELFVLPSENAACGSDVSCLLPPRLAGEGNTSGDGSLGLLLPSTRIGP